MNSLAFDGVSFYKADMHEILHDISFTLEPGKTLGIMGATGAGKVSHPSISIGHTILLEYSTKAVISPSVISPAMTNLPPTNIVNNGKSLEITEK